MIDCTGAPVILEQMHNYVCYGGRIALVGWPHNPVSINTVRLMQKEIDVCPSRNSNKKFPEAIELIHDDKIPTDAMITKMVKTRGSRSDDSGYDKSAFGVFEGNCGDLSGGQDRC